MLYAVLAQRDSRNPYAIKSENITPNISLVEVNVESKDQVLWGLNYIFNKLLSHDFEPDLEQDQRHEKLRHIGYLINRVKRAGERTTLWDNARGALVKRGFPRERLNELIWA